ncbi:MAG: pantetheine-phosphate adenylyltransferase [Bacteroidales bacterium]|nr:pantetheine-phosphate adenylyltransferase [Bacteroidales bacterium]
MEKTAVFAGSFCPFTKGHEDIVRKALPLFDKLIIAIGHNINKKDLFPVEDRLRWIGNLYHNNPTVKVVSYTGLTVDFCKEVGANYLVRGLRNPLDFMQEQELAQVNRHLNPDVETVFLLASPGCEIISSSLVRELWSNGADYTPYVSYKLPEFPAK